MSLVSKFAHLWLEDSSSSPTTSETSDVSVKTTTCEEDPIKFAVDLLLKSFEPDPEPVSYCNNEYDAPTVDLFASFGYDTSFGNGGGGSSPRQLDTSLSLSPSRLNNTSADDRAFDSSPCSPWLPENASGVTQFRNVCDAYNVISQELLNIKETLTAASNVEPANRGKISEFTLGLQKQLFHSIMGIDIPPPPYSSQDMSNESQVQAKKFLRDHAVHGTSEPFIWSGILPRRDYQNAVFSCKVFLGGVPYDMTEFGMIQAFKPFGNVKVEWPGKEMNPLQHKGYAYIIFENEKQVKTMLHNCTRDYSQDGKWFCKLTSRRVRMKDVEVIPWALSDSNFAVRPSKLESRLTIFVGALHGMLNAEGLAKVMEEVFHGVVHAGIDTDRNKYPIGSGRVSFDNFHSYFSAINGAYVEIKSAKFTKVVQVDPYLEDSNCSYCSLQQAPYFCRQLECFRYYCRTCFDIAHMAEPFRTHRPLMRNPNKKSRQTSPTASGFTSPASGVTSPTCCNQHVNFSNFNNITGSGLLGVSPFNLNSTFIHSDGSPIVVRPNYNPPVARFIR